MTTFRLVVGLRDATRLMTRENDGRGALAVCEAACGDQTLASVVLVLLRSYAERYGGARRRTITREIRRAVVKLLTGNAASSTLAGAIFHQVMTGGSIPAVMMSRGTRVRVEDVDEPSSPADSRFPNGRRRDAGVARDNVRERRDRGDDVRDQRRRT